MNLANDAIQEENFSQTLLLWKSNERRKWREKKMKMQNSWEENKDETQDNSFNQLWFRGQDCNDDDKDAGLFSFSKKSISLGKVINSHLNWCSNEYIMALFCKKREKVMKIKWGLNQSQEEVLVTVAKNQNQGLSLSLFTSLHFQSLCFWQNHHDLSSRSSSETPWSSSSRVAW